MRTDFFSRFETRAPFCLNWLFVVLSLTHFGCNEKEQEKYQIGFSQCVSDDRWRKAMHNEMKREVFYYQDEIELEIKDAGGDNNRQIQQIEEFIAQGVDLLMVSPNESAPITPVIEKAFNNGIPVIVLDRKTTSNLYTAYIGADNYEIGRIAGKYVSGLIDEGAKVLEIWGLKGSSPAINRSTGFHEALVSGNTQIIRIFADWTKETAKSELRAKLAEGLEVDLVFAHNDEMCLGAYEVFKESDKSDSCIFIGVDALSGSGGGIQYVADGVLDATFLYPTGGEEAIHLAHRMLNNLPFEKENLLHTTIVDRNNVRIMKLQTDEILSQQRDIEKQQTKIGEQIQLYNNQRLALYLLFASLTLSIILGAFALYALREKKLANRDLEQKNIQILEQKEEIQQMAYKAEEASKAKFRFFTNISHEFRTPLTLILGPIDRLLANRRFTVDQSVRQDLDLIRKNAYRLLRLVNQLMSFRKIEHGKLQLQVTEQDLVNFVNQIIRDFDTLAEQRNIDFRLISRERSINVWFDKNWLDKVIFNLLSNAFKFTPESGYVHLTIEKDPAKDLVFIKVEDNGKGMSREQLEHAFDRFYSGAEFNDLSTGLGLSLSKEIIELHKGSIAIESAQNVGTLFTINLLLGSSHFEEKELTGKKPETEFTLDKQVLLDEITQIDEVLQDTSNSKEATLLVIEDNKELALFLEQSLGKIYNVLVAHDGEMGSKLAIGEIPDVIICDIMIPKRDGLAVTKSLKSDSRTSHIPIILLTAKIEDEQKLAGIKSGADLYLTKPFNFNFLNEHIRTLLKNRESLKSYYLETIQPDNAPNVDADYKGNPDMVFVEKFKSIVKHNLSNANFGVQDICTEIGFSRVQLYRKVKALLACSVNDYINTMRLKKALELLRKSNASVAEIAYETGFSSPTYFSTAFKAHFKISPSEVRKA